ncbi:MULTISPECIES: penicillin-binding transpeptidase domain-containing protein [unclassified Gordonia (in: high G+C Gram-positive bacteria)]|uniref:penicillin-binding transpeptidase domain-containing protein n=1 Tax=unclassified Gordonia (in: high G+C Gram-positive bacteria) TaxID=2657482 RepID=UPI001F0D1A38|nr:penicillin-binding protein 2 [Gordonia sp. ABSL49_1]MCH5644445.1 penicillin-binding protein 2 [Gordonia sp. ABSL49_1]
MNKPIRRVSVAVILMMVALLANATYVQVFKANSLRTDSRNDRILLDEFSRQRGLITAGGTVIASSVPTDGRFKFQRVYPGETAFGFAPITGYFSHIYGNSQIEDAENSILNGSDDRLFGQRFMDMLSGRDPRGGNVVTTIDPRIQRLAYNALRNGPCDGPCRGSLVALQPNTGKILAMVSTPSFDPNLLASHDADEQFRNWDRLTKDPRQPTLNHAINQLYPPGSTFKVITSAAALRDGIDTSIRLTASPSIVLPGTNQSLENYDGETCPGSSGGTVTLETAFKFSCNTAFADLVTTKMKDATTVFTETARLFGIDQPGPNIPMTVTESTVGSITSPDVLAQSAIGQRDVRLTPLQNAMIAATVANGGVRMRPYLVDKLQAADLRTLETTQPATINQPITSDQASTLTRMMVLSEQETNGSGGAVTVASKTGTAELSDPNATPVTWYIAFGPSTNAQVALAVVVENGRNGVKSVGADLAPIGREVINAVVGGPGR